jgi:uncharacterized membrane protein
MRMFCTGLVLLALAGLIGCSGGSSGTSEKHAGGPGAATSASQKAPVVGESEGTFDLDPPTLAVRLKQGESKEVKIGIKRGENFNEDVTLKFEGSPDMPKGVTFDPASPKINHGDKEVSFQVKATDDASVGDFKIKVKGKPTKGKEAANTFEIKIDKK